MAEKSIRFSIWDGKNIRATTWLLMVNPPDSLEIYLINRVLGGDLKISMHESGQWHWALTTKTYEERKDLVPESADEGRKIVKWPRPDDISKGVTVAQRILTPHSAVSTPISKKDRNKIDFWIPNAPEQMATEIYIIITDKDVKTEGWPAKNSMNTSLVGKLGLVNGDTVWVVSKVVDIPKIGKQSLKFNISKEDFLNAENPRFLGFLDHSDGSKVLFDGRVNVRK